MPNVGTLVMALALAIAFILIAISVWRGNRD